MPSYEFTGGDKLQAKLAQIARKLGTGGTVRVGFLSGATYPAAQGKRPIKVAQVAFWDEFGTAHTHPRPFFRGMIADDSPTWGEKLAAIAKASGYDSQKTLTLMGEYLKDKLVSAIAQWPADNAPSTVRRKKFNKGLVDTGVMQRAVDYEVES